MNVIRDVKNRMKNKLYLHAKCPCGEIGRHAILRGGAVRCAGSNPVVGTKKFRLISIKGLNHISTKTINNEILNYNYIIH